MKEHRKPGALALALALAVPLAPATALADLAADEAAIRDIWSSYAEARVAGDAERWLSLWDENGVQMPPGMHARGKDVLEAGVPKAFAAGGVKSMMIEPEEIVVAEDWAWTRGNYVSDRVVQGEEVHIDGKFMTILRRQDDGSWKIYRDIFNANPE